MNVVDNGTFTYAKRGNLVDADASDHLVGHGYNCRKRNFWTF